MPATATLQTVQPLTATSQEFQITSILKFLQNQELSFITAILKEAKTLFQQALNCNPSTIVFYMDIVMNSLTVAPWLNPTVHKPLSLLKVLNCLKLLKRKANAKDW